MSEIEEIDIGSHYVYVASSMEKGLERVLSGFLEGNINSPPEIPAQVINESKDLFSLALELFRKSSYSTRASAHWKIVRDVLEISTGKQYHREKFIPEVRKLLELTNDLKDPTLILEHRKEEYQLLRDFFKTLYKVSDENRYESYISGKVSKYRYI